MNNTVSLEKMEHDFHGKILLLKYTDLCKGSYISGSISVESQISESRGKNWVFYASASNLESVESQTTDFVN